MGRYIRQYTEGNNFYEEVSLFLKKVDLEKVTMKNMEDSIAF